jgi:AcrR family transcriptional regulator
MRTREKVPSDTAAPDGLKPTRNTEARDQLSEIQRARIVAAMIEVASEQGAGSATVARVVARSGVSRRTFYELFEDREDCFIAAFDRAVRRIAAVVLAAYRQPLKWRLRIRGGLGTLLELLDREPGVARLVIVEALGAGPKALERRRRVLAKMIPVVEEGRKEARTGDGPSPLTAEGIVGGVFSLIHSRLLENGPLVELLNPLMAMIVLPYLGPAAAREEHLAARSAGSR